MDKKVLNDAEISPARYEIALSGISFRSRTNWAESSE
jgi:hypothetical protein